jgi:hypothetical protein
MTTVDVSDPASPAVLARTEVEGGYVSARASDGLVRVVTTSYPALPFVDPWLLQQERAGAGAPPGDDMTLPVEPDPALDAELAAEARERNERVVRDATAADWLPDLVQRDADGTVTGTSPVPCEAVARPEEAAGTGTLTVLALDPSAEEPLLGTTSVSADGSVVYASTDRLYVATTRGGWTWGRTDGRRFPHQHGAARVRHHRPRDLLPRLRQRRRLAARFLGDGRRRRLPEGGHDQPGPRRGDRRGTGHELQRGRAEGDRRRPGRDGAGRRARAGEQIRSLRWFDDLAVVVTFEQTDPLYTVDLSDPAAPRVLGELKVTGYSGYLHPVGDGVLLGVGQAGDEAGTLLGAKVETYDVRDLAAPGVIADLVWPGASSPTEWDSRLFAYVPGRRTAVLPLEQYDEQTGAYSSGLVAVALDADGTPREAGRWVSGDAGSTYALATDGDIVVAEREAWPISSDEEMLAPRRSLALLDAGDLTVRAEVDLG